MAKTDEVKAKWKNVSLDADLVGKLNAVADALEPKFGFRPTLSQTIRHLISRSHDMAALSLDLSTPQGRV